MVQREAELLGRGEGNHVLQEELNLLVILASLVLVVMVGVVVVVIGDGDESI